MRILNTTGWNTPWLRQVLAYCGERVSYPIDQLTVARFAPARRNPFAASADPVLRTLRVTINPLNVYPNAALPGRGLVPMACGDAALAVGTAESGRLATPYTSTGSCSGRLASTV